MLTQKQAQQLIEALKEAVRKELFEWISDKRYDEIFVTVDKKDLKFILSLNRNPFEIRLHLRTKRENIGLLRIDANPFHTNPDGTELRDTPHIHVYREGYDLLWAEPIDWYSTTDPVGTLERFLYEAHARFPAGIQHILF